MTAPHVHLVTVAWAAVAVMLYLAAVRAVDRHRVRPWPARRTAAFVAGVGVILLAVASPLAERADLLLSVHMWQHLMLVLAAAPLIVLGAPLSLALRALRGRARAGLAAAVASRPVRALVHPLVTWTAFTAAMLATHLTGFYDLAVRSGVVHAGEHAIYLAAGLLFWLPVLGANPVPQVRSWLGRMAYLVLAMPPMSVVAAILVSADAPRYAAYAESAAALGVSALADQREAGGMMAAVGGLVLALAAFERAFHALREEEHRQQVLDALEASA